MSKLFWKIWYWRPKDGYYYIRNRFFKRWDLIRTGLKKSQWWDKDHLMLYGMMGLLVDFVEKECGIYYVDGAPEQNEIKKKLMDLYTEWIVDYPNLVRLEAEALNAWANSTEMVMGKREQVGESKKLSTSKLMFVQKNGYTKERSDELFKLHMKAEAAVMEKEQDMLMRLVELRQFMWT